MVRSGGVVGWSYLRPDHFLDHLKVIIVYFLLRLVSSVRLAKIVALVKKRFQNNWTEAKSQMN